MTTRSIVERAGTLVGLVLVAAIFGALVGPQFFAPTNLELMARQMAIVSIAAVMRLAAVSTLASWILISSMLDDERAASASLRT